MRIKVRLPACCIGIISRDYEEWFATQSQVAQDRILKKRNHLFYLRNLLIKKDFQNAAKTTNAFNQFRKGEWLQWNLQGGSLSLRLKQLPTSNLDLFWKFRFANSELGQASSYYWSCYLKVEQFSIAFYKLQRGCRIRFHIKQIQEIALFNYGKVNLQEKEFSASDSPSFRRILESLSFLGKQIKLREKLLSEAWSIPILPESDWHG